MSVERLHQAAAKIRETAAGAPFGQWTQFGQIIAADSGKCTCGSPLDSSVNYAHEPYCRLEPIAEADAATAALIALMAPPPVALAVARWLDETAETWRLSGDAENWQSAIDVADLILSGAE